MQHNKLAIVTRSSGAGSQTFIKRHIDQLNDGNTVLVSKSKPKEKGFDKPLFLYRRKRLEPYARSFGIGTSLFSGQLRGQTAGIRSFFDLNNVSHALFEFGYVATELGPRIFNTGRPTYCMFRGNDASSRLRDPVYLRLLRKTFPHLSGIIAVSQHLLDNLAEHGLVHPRSLVVPSGVDVDLFKPGKPEPGYCVCVGRLVEKKSPRHLIRAFAPVAETNNLVLDFIGSGPELEPARALAKELGIAERTRFSGSLPHREVVARMRRASLYLQHFHTPENGDTEGMPNVIQEAMACALPIVTTRHAGIPDHLQDRKTALLVEPRDAPAFTRAISELCNSPQLGRKLGQAAREYALANLDYRISHQRIETFMGIRP